VGSTVGDRGRVLEEPFRGIDGAGGEAQPAVVVEAGDECPAAEAYESVDGYGGARAPKAAIAPRPYHQLPGTYSGSIERERLAQRA
jgi:hypothetical protein